MLKLPSAQMQGETKEEKFKGQPHLKKAFKEFDRLMQPILDREAKKLNFAVSKVEAKLERCEKAMLKFCDQTSNQAMADLELAEKLINKELRFKTIMSQWANYFLARSHTETLDMLSWSFARFSLNICFGWAEIAPRHLIQAGIHKSLGDLIKFRSELVVGPALMALVHISIHDEMKPAITLINVLSTIIKLMVTSESKPVLCQCCKLVASLALHFPNKTLITNSGCMHGLLDLVLGTNKEIDDSISYAALTGIVNTVCGNDANRLLICDLNGIKPILSIMQNTSDNKILEQAVRCLGNICYCNSFCAGEMLSQGADVIIVEVLNSGDIMSIPDVVFTCLATLANMCFTETTQSHIGSSNNLVDTALRILEYGQNLLVVGEAAFLLLGVMWMNKGNKILVAGKGLIPIVVKRIIHHSKFDDEDNLDCLEKCCAALATCLLYNNNHERFLVNRGLEAMIDICKVSKSQRIVAAVIQSVVCLVPSPEKRLRWHEEEYTIPVEKFGALNVLKKAKFTGFGHLPSPPQWLTTAITIMSMTDDGLALQEPWIKEEFVDRMVYCKEFNTRIVPDVDVTTNENFRGLLFSVY